MNDIQRAAVIKQCRRGILDTMLCVYPSPFEFESIAYSLLHLELDDDLLWKDVNYLCDKGYLVCINAAQKPARKNRMYKLTAAGNEIANRLTHDAALMP